MSVNYWGDYNTSIIFVLSIIYYAYVVTFHPPSPERETFISEIGEEVGEVALWAFYVIYLRTLLKLLLAKGSLSKRLLPDRTIITHPTRVNLVIGYLDRTHIYFGIAAIALVLLHIGMMGLHTEVWFFPPVLGLVLWQGLFGAFISWRFLPGDVRRLSYMVHAQLITGIGIGIFAYFGHVLLDD
jgi:hypothetical protein